MKPLNYAILKYMTMVEQACPEDVIEALKVDYGASNQLRKAAVLESLMTAEQNGLLDKSSYNLGEDGEVRVYFKINDYGAETINKYIR